MEKRLKVDNIDRIIMYSVPKVSSNSDGLSVYPTDSILVKNTTNVDQCH